MPQLWLLYMCFYFADRLAWLVPLTGRKRMVAALWGTALRTRETWARVSGRFLLVLLKA